MVIDEFDLEFYNSVLNKIKVLMEILYNPTVDGISNIPMSGPCILAGNHISFLDPILVGTSIERPVHFMAKKELFRLKCIEAILLKLGAFPVNRGETDMASFRNSIRILKSDDILGIFPEGHRNKELSEFKSGTMKIAAICNVPVVPFGISGEYKIGGGITLRFGEVIKSSKNNDNDLYLKEKVRELIY